jgi:DNA-binding MarR family transcriptional regulator
MNNLQKLEAEEYRALQILDELSNNNSLTQRELSKRLGIALGLVNSYLKNLIKKGYITVKNIPPRRYVYYLTPKGFAEKSRLTLRLLQDYTRVYRQAKATLKELFRQLEAEGAKKVVFAGSDEVAEIAYITIQETELELVGVVDEERAGEEFFEHMIRCIDEIKAIEYDRIIIVSYVKRNELIQNLLEKGINRGDLKEVFKQI